MTTQGNLAFLYASFDGNAPVDVAMRPGRSFQIEFLNLDGRERLGGDQYLHVPVQMTAIGEAHLQPVQAALPLLHARLRAEAVFEKQELAARFQYPVDLAQGLANFLDAAQGKRADGAIEAVALKGKPFAAENPMVNLDLRPPDSPLRQPVHSGVGIGRRDSVDLGGVVRQVQPRPEADLQNVAVSHRKQSLPMLRHERPVH